MNATDVLKNAACGAAVAFVGSFVISVFRSAKLLDDDRASRIKQMEDGAREKISGLEMALAECQENLNRKHPADEYKESEVTKWLEGFEDSERQVLKWILNHGPATANEIRNGLGMLAQDSIIKLVSSGAERGFIQSNSGPPYPRYRIHDNYHVAVKDVLYPPPGAD
jgi:hypothetical protein